MKLILRYSIKELLNNRGFSIFFTLTLGLGMLGFIFFYSAQESVRTYFQNNLREFLTGDFRVTTRGTPPENLAGLLEKVIGDKAVEVSTVSMFSMVSSPELSKLVNINAIEPGYPLYGNFELEEGAVDEGLLRQRLIETPGVWLDKSLMEALGVQLGDKLKLGSMEFVLNGLVKKPPSLFSGFEAMATPVFIGLDYIHETGLTEFGSRVNYATFYKLKNPADYDALSTELSELIEGEFTEFDQVNFRNLEEGSDRVNSLVQQISGFFSLITLLALFLGGVGMFYLFKGFARKRVKSTAILKCLGLEGRKAYLITITQLAMMSAVAALLAFIANSVLLQIAGGVASEYLNNFSVASLAPGTMLAAFVIALSSALVFTFPIYLGFRNIKPALLFNEAGNDNRLKPTGATLLPYLPCVLFFWLVACLFTSFRIGSLFMLIFMGALAVMTGAGYLMILLAQRFSSGRTPAVRMSLRSLSRHRTATISSFAAIATGTFLIAVIPQLANGIKEEIATPESSVLPSFFLFDIQPEQKEPLAELLETEGYELMNLSPMIRARLASINGVTAKDKELQASFSNRAKHMLSHGMNISYREKLSDSEKIIEGKAFSGPYADDGSPVEISLETRFADDMQSKIGDKIVLDVQGVEIEGIVTSFRQVRWNSFQPNFFFVLQPGVLEGAPHTLIANVLGVPVEQREQLQAKISRQFPNVTAVDVGQLITMLLGIADKALGVVLFLALLAVLSGILVVFMIALYETRSRSGELALLKVLGSTRQDLRRIILIEFALPGVFASIVGIVISGAATIFVSQQLFDNMRALSPGYLAGLLVVVTLILATTSLLATGRIIREKPLELIRSE